MGETSEKQLPPLEQCRDIHFDNVYWITDQLVIGSLTQHYILNGIPYGLEVGFGAQPTRVGIIKPDIDWMFTDPEGFTSAKGVLDAVWEDQDMPKKNNYFLKTSATNALIKNADTIVYRNPNTELMGGLVPEETALLPGQQIVLVVDGEHIAEVDFYKDLLGKKGYDATTLVAITGRALSYNYAENQKGFLFRYQKPIEEAPIG